MNGRFAVGITGAAGYVGARVAAAAAIGGWTVRGVDDFSGPVSFQPTALPVVAADFGSEAGLRALEGSDVVLHLAAISGVVACERDPEGAARTNICGTERLLAWCAEKRVPLAFASSMAVIGRTTGLTVTEDTAAHPSNVYSSQKAQGEELVRRASEKVPTAVVRMSNVYGVYSSGDRWVAKGNVITEFARQAATGVLRVNAPGTQRRDFVHIDDATDAWISIARILGPHSAPSFQSYLLASGEVHSVLEVAGLVRSEFSRVYPGHPIKVEVLPNPRANFEILDDQLTIDSSRTWLRLGQKPKRTIEFELPKILRAVPPVRP